MEGDVISPDEWIVRPDGQHTRLISLNCVGDYKLPPNVKPAKAATLLSPQSITQALDGTMDNNKCTCTSYPNKSRCQHSFSFEDVRKLREKWFTSTDAVQAFSASLKKMPANVKAYDGQDARDRRVSYFLEDKPVCKGFFMAALGISKKCCDRISAFVRDKEPALNIRRKLPKYKSKESQYRKCVEFWREFFGDQSQTSGDGHRYFPINLAIEYIFNNCFWPWWKDDRGDWKEDSRDPTQVSPVLGSDPKLAAARPQARAQNTS